MGLAVVTTACLAFAGACGDDDASTTPTPAASAAGSPSATATVAVSAPPNTIDLGGALFTAVAPDAEDLQTTSSPLAIGDFDGDGAGDLAVGAVGGDGPANDRENAGEAYVLLGAGGLTGEVDLGEEADFTVYGAAENDNLGTTVLAADLNADGIDDLVIGAPGVTAGDDPRTDQGRVYVFFGSPSFGGSVDLASDEGFEFVLTGAEGFSRVGQSLASGDFNADGLTDLLAGAPFAGREPGTAPGGPRLESGAVYVAFGASDLGGELNIAFADAGFTLANDERHAQLGAAVAAGDVNGDGIDDIITSAPHKDIDGIIDAGALYIVYGAAGLSGNIPFSGADVTIGSDVEQSRFGNALAAADLNGDGAAEVVVSASQSAGPDGARAVGGEVYVFEDLGVPGVFGLAEAALYAHIYGAEVRDSLAQLLASADFDGDGAPETVLTAPFGDGLGAEESRRGQAYVFFGAALQGTIDLADSLEGLAFIPGAADGDHLGGGLAIGDLDGDERPELALAATGGDRRGAVYVLPVSLPTGQAGAP